MMPVQLNIRPVDKVQITVLVDNAIEWFYPWPASEFQQEILVQLSQDPPICPTTHTPILDLENFCCAAHGLSLLVTTYIDDEQHSMLFDCGPDTKSIERNVKALKTDLCNIERIVLSHWHGDHSLGIPKALTLITEARTRGGQLANTVQTIVDVHPDRPIARGIWPDRSLAPIGRLPEDPTVESMEGLHAKVEKHDEPHAICGETMYVSGHIERQTSFETGIVGGCQWINGKWTREPGNPGSLIPDERYLAIDVKGKGLVIFSSCSHAGIVNVCKSALAAFGNSKPIYAVIGGFHLGGTGMEERIPETVDYFANEAKPTYLCPMHCTGFNAKVALANALGKAVVPAGAGHRITFASE